MKTLTKLAANTVTVARVLGYVLAALCVGLHDTAFVLRFWRKALDGILAQDWRFQALLAAILVMAVLGNLPPVY